jgi:hypothetical protein
MERTRLRVYANMVLRTITSLSGRKKQIAKKKLHSAELHNLYFSQNIIMRFNLRIDWAYSMNGREGNFMQRFGRETQGKHPLRRTKSRWEDISKKEFERIVCKSVSSLHQGQNRCTWWALVKTIMKCRVP